jgi:hypothetical protein
MRNGELNMSMNNKTQLRVEQLIENNNGDIRSLAAWVIGYIHSLEMEVNGARRELGAPPKSTLNDSLDDQIDA